MTNSIQASRVQQFQETQAIVTELQSTSLLNEEEIAEQCAAVSEASYLLARLMGHFDSETAAAYNKDKTTTERNYSKLYAAPPANISYA
jgi:hypothetical protein